MGSSELGLLLLLPQQIGTQNSLELLEDPKAEVVDEIAAKLGLRKVRNILLAFDGGIGAVCWGPPGGWHGQVLSGTELPATQGQVQAQCVYWAPLPLCSSDLK